MSAVTEEIRLVPFRSIRVRMIVCGLLVALVLIGLPEWHSVIFFAISVALMLGTFPRAWIRGGRFEREFRLGFLRIHFKQWPLDEVEHLETGTEEKLGRLGTLWLLLETFFLSLLFDRLFPWLGGDYKIWLRTFGDRRALAWQGYNEAQFRANLQALETATGLTAVRGSDFDVVTPAQLLETLEELPGGRLLKKIRLPERLLRRFRGRGDPPFRAGSGRSG